MRCFDEKGYCVFNSNYVSTTTVLLLEHSEQHKPFIQHHEHSRKLFNQHPKRFTEFFLKPVSERIFKCPNSVSE